MALIASVLSIGTHCLIYKADISLPLDVSVFNREQTSSTRLKVTTNYRLLVLTGDKAVPLRPLERFRAGPMTLP